MNKNINETEVTISKCLLGTISILFMSSQHTEPGTLIHMHTCLHDELNNNTELGGHHNQRLSLSLSLSFTKADRNKLRNTYLEDIFSEL